MLQREGRKMRTLPKLELIDWSERCPHEDARTIARRQSTYCRCGKKEIGKLHCAFCEAGTKE
jgi:hypothetical protein